MLARREPNLSGESLTSCKSYSWEEQLDSEAAGETFIDLVGFHSDGSLMFLMSKRGRRRIGTTM